MEPEQKNAHFIKDLHDQADKLAEIRTHLDKNYNNDMNKDVAKVIRHAEHIILDHVDTLK